MLALETQQDFLVFFVQIWGDYLIGRINMSCEVNSFLFLLIRNYILSIYRYLCPCLYLKTCYPCYKIGV